LLYCWTVSRINLESLFINHMVLRWPTLSTSIGY
jgi:hypothetical protein